MPVSGSATSVLRTCVFRPRLAPTASRANAVIGVKRSACRTFAEQKNVESPKAPEGQSGPYVAVQEHVSEEAAKMAKAQGGQGPDIEGQGTPVQDVSGCQWQSTDT